MTASRIGRYEILRPLGRGAMGLVYLALDPQIDRTIALKTIRFDDAGGSFNREEAKARFLKEARISGRLQHPNIVTVYDVGEDGGVLYLAMEYVSGGSFAQKLTGPAALDTTDRIRVVAEVAEALAHAHERGVIHRDIKPANILLTEGLAAKVTDFGIGKLLSGDTELTSTGQMVGSPAYMSPEQIRGDKVDTRTDIFSLGVVLYQALTAKKPFPADTLTTLVYQILHEEPSDPLEVKTDLPPEISTIMKGCLAKNRDDRYADAGVLADDLRRVLGISPTSSTASFSDSRLRKPKAAAGLAVIAGAEGVSPTVSLPASDVPMVAESAAADAADAEETAMSPSGSIPPPPPLPVPSPHVAPLPAPPPAAAKSDGMMGRVALVGVSVLILAGVGIFAVRELGKPAAPPQATPPQPVPTAAPIPTFAPPATPVPVATPSADAGAVPPRLTELAPTKAIPTPKASRSPRATVEVPPKSPPGPVEAVTVKPPASTYNTSPDHTVYTRRRVKVNVSPSQARVFLDGRYIGISDDWDGAGGGALVAFGKEGRHRFRFTYPGRRDLVIDVVVESNADDDKIELDQSMEKGEPHPPFGPEGKLPRPDYRTTGTVRFQIKPSEALLTVDGRILGKASNWADSDLKIPEMGIHDVTLSMPGYKPKQLRILSGLEAEKETTVVKESLKKE